jgi:hypothetical protein
MSRGKNLFIETVEPVAERTLLLPPNLMFTGGLRTPENGNSRFRGRDCRVLALFSIEGVWVHNNDINDSLSAFL